MVVPYIREILGGIIFFKNKKNLNINKRVWSSCSSWA